MNDKRRRFRLPWRSAASIDADLETALEFHLEMRAAELVRLGLAAPDARREAEHEFGDLERARTYCRTVDARSDRALRLADRLAALRQDAAYAWRALGRNPTFAAVSLLTLALAIGANTAIFSVTRTVLLQPLPYGAPASLVALYETSAQNQSDRLPLSPPNFVDYRARQRALTDLAAYVPRPATWRPAGADPTVLDVIAVSPNLFHVLGVTALYGRTFLPGEDRSGSDHIAVVSYAFWQHALGGRIDSIGRTLVLDDRSYQVVGVAPQGFTLGTNEAMWVPLNLSDDLAAAAVTRKQHFLRAIGRLKPRGTLDAARSDILAVARRLQAEYPNADAGYLATVVPLHDVMTGDLRPALLLLQCAAALVLLIACGNLANVTLSRTMSRRREVALRAALGGGRARLIQQVLMESVLLGLVGGAIGVGVAVVATRTLLALNPDTLPSIFTIGIDGRVVVFSLAVSLATGVLFGLVPAIDAVRVDLITSLREAGPGSGGGRGGEGLRRGLVVAQVGLAIVLLVGAGLLIRSFGALTQAPLGFATDHVLTAELSVTGTRYDASAAVNQFYDRVFAELRGSPGVIAVGATMHLPTREKATTELRVEGGSFDPRSPPQVGYVVIRGDYFAALKTRLLAGRLFNDTDTPDGRPTAIVNAIAARRFFPGGDAIGRRVRLGPVPDGPLTTIVGVVDDTRDEGVDIAGRPTVYVNHRQETWMRSLAVLVRTAGDPDGAVCAIRRAVRAADPGIAIAQVERLDDIVGSSLAGRRFALGLASCFAGIAMVLAAVGIYGVLAYTVTSRRREFGVRLALGATARSVMMLVIRQGVTWALVGLALGIVGALLSGRLLGGMLYGVRPIDALTYAAVAGGALAVVGAACVMPAARAARVDPLTSMRAE